MLELLELMGNLATNKAGVWAQIPRDQMDYIRKRRQRMHWSNSLFISEIVNHWFRIGCPALSESDINGDIKPSRPSDADRVAEIVAKPIQTRAQPAPR